MFLLYLFEPLYAMKALGNRYFLRLQFLGSGSEALHYTLAVFWHEYSDRSGMNRRSITHTLGPNFVLWWWRWRCYMLYLLSSVVTNRAVLFQCRVAVTSATTSTHRWCSTWKVRPNTCTVYYTSVVPRPGLMCRLCRLLSALGTGTAPIRESNSHPARAPPSHGETKRRHN